MEGVSIHAVLVTYMRPDGLDRTAASLGRQVRKPDALYVFDNAPSGHGERVAEQLGGMGIDVSYMPSSVNVGPAGAVAEVMAYVLPTANDADWFMILNDDMEFSDPQSIERREKFACEMVVADPSVAGVGKIGHRFDWSKAMLIRPPHDEIVGAIDVDYLATGFGPMFRVGAIRDAGTMRPELFFGFEEVEFGLRLRRSGYRLVASGDLWKPTERTAKLGLSRVRVRVPAWHRYYKLRNLIVMLRDNDRTLTAVRVSLVRGLLKPLLNLPLAPRAAGLNLKMNVHALWDAWRGRLGVRYTPTVNRATEAKV